MPVKQLLTPTWSQNPAKTEPKPSQNPVQNAPKFDVKLRTPKNESEQTLPHFSSFLLIPNTPKSASNRSQNAAKVRLILDNLFDAPKNAILDVFGRFLAPNMAPSWLYLGPEAGYNELLCWPCLNHGWPGRIRTQKPAQNETDFGRKWFQIRLQEALHSALMLAPAELLLHNEYDAIFIVHQANHRAIMHRMHSILLKALVSSASSACSAMLPSC